MAFEGLTPASPKSLDDLARRASIVINRLLQGKTNNVLTVTLTANSATTTVTVPKGLLGSDSFIGLSPLTANAAGAVSGLYVSAIDADNNQFTLTHANTAAIDKTFRYVVIG